MKMTLYHSYKGNWQTLLPLFLL